MERMIMPKSEGMIGVTHISVDIPIGMFLENGIHAGNEVEMFAAGEGIIIRKLDKPVQCGLCGEMTTEKTTEFADKRICVKCKNALMEVLK